MNIGQRIKDLRKSHGINQTTLADKIDVSKQTLYKYENNIITNIPTDKIEKLSDALNVSPSYLMGWNENGDEYDAIIRANTRSFPIIGEVACGEPIVANENWEGNIEGNVSIDADFCLVAKGDSMINARICDGDLVFVKKQPTVENGEIAVVLIDDEVTLKRFYKYKDMILLKPENPKFNDIVLDASKDVTVLGKAVFFRGDIV